MGLPAKLLTSDERIVRHMRTHFKAMIGPVLLLVLLIVGLAAGLRFMPADWKPAGPIALGVLVALLFIFGVLIPWMKWVTTTYTITNRRIITRSGIFNKIGHDIPLSRISNVTYERHLIDRMLGCGTLVLETSASAPLKLHDVPHVEEINVEMADLLFQDANPEEDAGTPAK